MHLANALAADYDLTLLCLCERPPGEQPPGGIAPFAAVHTVVLPRWKSYLKAALALPTHTPLQLAYYRSGAFRQALSQLLPSHAGVLAHLHRTGQYVESLAGSVPALLELTDAVSLNYRRVREQRTRRGVLPWVYTLEQRRLERYERALPGRFSRTWLVSPVDIRYLYGASDSTRVGCIPVPVDLSDYPFCPGAGGKTVLFVGNLRSVQNRDACAWFVASMLPALSKRIPGIRFRVVGSIDPRFRAELEAHPGVEVRGEVARVKEHAEDAFCGICPMRIGAGMQNKVLNYLALGVPCVTSELGLEGIEAEPGADLLCFKTADQAVEQIAQLHASATLRGRLALGGLAVAKRYSTEALYPRIRAEALDVFSRQPEVVTAKPDHGKKHWLPSSASFKPRSEEFRDRYLSPWIDSRAKRALDICIAAALLLVLAPLFLLLWALVRLGSEGPAIFQQQRCGLGNSQFTIFKFRTMIHSAGGAGAGRSRKGDPRITAHGALLRKFKLDELPQLVNVLRGQMSLVGPRPKLPAHQTGVLPCRPGLTGAASVAFAAEEELLAGFPSQRLESFHALRVTPLKTKLDEAYLREASFQLDVRILVQTLLRRGRLRSAENLSEAVETQSARWVEAPSSLAGAPEQPGISADRAAPLLQTFGTQTAPYLRSEPSRAVSLLP